MSSFKELELKDEIELNNFSQHVVHCMNSDIGVKNDPFFCWSEENFIFPIVSVNEISGMQMLLFVNVIL